MGDSELKRIARHQDETPGGCRPGRDQRVGPPGQCVVGGTSPVIERWRYVTNAVVYNAQHYADLGPEAVDGTARALLVQPLGQLTPDQEYEALREAIETDARPLTTIPTRFDDNAIRDYLVRIITRLDELRPWPEPRFQKLPIDRWEEFLDARLIAFVDAPFPYVQDKLGAPLVPAPGDIRQYLLIRLQSGTEVGFVWPFWDQHHGTAVVTTDTVRPQEEIIEEILDASVLDPEMVVSLPPESAQYETTPLQPEFQGENLPGNPVWNGKHVRYLEESERLSYRVTVHNGLLYDSNGAPLDTRSARSLWTPEGGRAIFVMDADGTLYWSPWHILGEFHHSSLLAGAPVAGAGEIGAVAGQVRVLSDKSTHYRPERRFTNQVVERLRAAGVSIADQQVEYNSPT
ncbi:hypothetical protein [Nocardia blacklockiae]|uniref:hypothetical protein n=1 Tax=Nocardia blacklockiae TaxID=480036 RepID=UPI001892E0B4|nr:hypothetical protein [Nocardia blacklockiae]MBF6173847.1 hypothetical protein [Nocardia blacklockiae]